MHITPTQAAAAHLIPMVHVLDLIENKAIGTQRQASEASAFAVAKLLENGRKHGICDECMQANAEWYAKSFDICVVAHSERGVFNHSSYPEFVSPCWPKPTEPTIIVPK